MSKNGKKGVEPRLRFPEFKKARDWEVSTIDNIATKIGSGITPRGGSENYKKNGRPFVRSQNVGWGTLILDDIAFIDEKTHSTFSSTEIMMDDVFLNITGASIGRSAIADKRVVGGNVNQHVCIIRLKDGKLPPAYLCQYLLSPFGQNQIDSFQAGGNREGLNFGQIRSIKLPTPTEPKEQGKIADCLSSLDEVIAAQGEKVEALKTYKKGLLQQLFPQEGQTTPTLRFPEFEKSGDWEEKRVGDYLKESLIKGNAGDIAKKLTVKLWGKGVFEKNEAIKGSENTKYYARKTGQFIYSKLDFLNQAFGIIPDHLNGFETTVDLPCFDISKNLDAKFFLEYVMREIFYKKYGETADGSRKAKRIHADVFLEFPIFLPDLKEQQKISKALSVLDKYIEDENERCEILKAHKKGLSQQLFPIAESPEE